MKRVSIIGAILLVFLGANSGLGKTLAQSQVTLRAIGFDSCITQGLQLQADAYTKANPKVTVKIDATAYTDLHEKEVVELSGGTGNYDIYSAVTEWLPEYISGGFLAPLTDYIKSKPPVDWPDTWSPGLMKFETDAKGTIFGLPHHSGPQMLYYRKDLFENPKEQAAFKAKYGYELKPPSTWDQFLDIAQFFTRPDQNLWGTVLTAKFGEQQLAHDFWLLLPSFGGGTGFDDKGNPTFNSDAGVKALQFYSDLINQAKVAPKASLTFGIPEAGDFYLAGTAAMHWNWSHIGANAEDPKLSKIVGKNGYTVIPVDKPDRQHAIYDSYWVLAIAASSKQKDAAYDFINFATDPVHDQLLAQAGCIPSRLSSWKNPDLLKKFPFYAIFEPSYSGFITSSPRLPAYEKLDDLMQRHISDALNGKVSAKDALDAAAKEMTLLLTSN